MLCTAPLSLGALPGIARVRALHAAADVALPVLLAAPPAELWGCREVFLCNAVRWVRRLLYLVMSGMARPLH